MEDPNANWGPEPNFNLNLNVPSLRSETPKLLRGGQRKDNVNKAAGKPGAQSLLPPDASTSPGDRDDPSRQRSRIPALANNRTEQKLKSPNPKRSSALSPKTQSDVAMSPKPDQTKQTSRHQTSESNLKPPRTPEPTTKTTNRTTHHREDGDKAMNLETKSPKMLHLPVTVQEPTNQSPTITLRPTGLNLEDQGAELAPLGIKSPSPKPCTQRRTCRTRTSSTSRTHLESKDSKPDAKATTSPNCRTAKGSRESLDSSSASRTSSGSKDGLDSKAASMSKARSKSGIGPKDKTEVKVSKSSTAVKSAAGSTPETASEHNTGPKTVSISSSSSSLSSSQAFSPTLGPGSTPGKSL